MDTSSPTLPPDVFEAVVTAFAETLIRHYRERVFPRVAEWSEAVERWQQHDKARPVVCCIVCLAPMPHARTRRGRRPGR